MNMKSVAVHPPLKWTPVEGEFTDFFLKSKSKNADGPTFEDLTKGPNSVLGEAKRILGRCLPPTEPSGSETGLVVGYVQSGKTLSFETVISLSRDNGYGLIIVIAGTKNNLLDQSVDRLKKDLGIAEGSEVWFHVANPNQSQFSQIDGKIKAWKKNPQKRSLLITVLKHGGHLEKLADLLVKISLKDVPTLIIDDESDQASLNTFAAKIQNGSVNDDTKSTTYEKILELRKAIPHHSYLQYTATPQANLLIAQTDLLNASFAELVTPGDDYTGGKSFFKENPKLVCTIPSADVATPDQALTSCPKSLLSAFRHFLLGAAQHSLTRDKTIGGKDRNRSMMVHPAVRTMSHKEYKTWLDQAKTAIIKFVEGNFTKKRSSVVAHFQTEYDFLKVTYSNLLPIEELIEAMIDDVFDDLVIVEVNGTPDAEKKIFWKESKYWVLVGGAKLDRGYTVEGLSVTYMPRPLGGSPAADTLQQRARFFGYKRSYLGLCRVFLQQDVKDAFLEYVEHEEFVRGVLSAHRGKPLVEWRRDFILSELLKPTRPNVIGISTRRIPVDGWLTPKALHKDPQAVLANRKLLSSMKKTWTKQYGPLINATSLPQFSSEKKISNHDALSDVPLKEVLEQFFLEILVRDQADAEQHTAILLAFAELLSKDPSLQVDVFFMNQLKPGYRSRVSGRGLPKEHLQAPINQYFSQSAATLNDKSFCSPSNITLQIRTFNLGTIPRDETSADIFDVAWYAVHVPSSLRTQLIIEKQ
jgi:hypothetical protein